MTPWYKLRAITVVLFLLNCCIGEIPPVFLGWITRILLLKSHVLFFKARSFQVWGEGFDLAVKELPEAVRQLRGADFNREKTQFWCVLVIFKNKNAGFQNCLKRFSQPENWNFDQHGRFRNDKQRNCGSGCNKGKLKEQTKVANLHGPDGLCWSFW